MRKSSSIAILAVSTNVLAACNYAEGAGNAGAGDTVVVPTGVGGYGDVPPEPRSSGDGERPPPVCNVTEEVDDDDQEQEEEGKRGDDGSLLCADVGGLAADGTTYAYCSGPCEAKCLTIAAGSFSPSVFKFATIVPDDGTDKGGGWQEASANLGFVRWTSLIPEWWTCPVTVGMPLRTTLDGKISPGYAATVAADVATQASSKAQKTSPDLPPGIFCLKFTSEMKSLFKSQYGSLGVSVK